MGTHDLPPRRHYYSVRAGRRSPDEGFGLPDFKRFFLATFDRLSEDGLFQQWFGYSCVDAGDVDGQAGADVGLFVFRKLRRMDLWPIRDRLDAYGEDDLFDIIEFLHDHASRGVDGHHHTFNQCGWHYNKFDARAGREIFRREMNDVLADYGRGYEVSTSGEILTLAEDEFAPMLSAELPHSDGANVTERVNAAMLKYRRRALSERRDAVRDLADVLEFLRPEAKKALHSKDEAELFQLVD